MKTFKAIDFFLQLALIAMTGVAALIDNEETLNPGFFIIAFGILQVISLLVNMSVGPQAWKQTAWRKFHLIGTAIVLLLIIVALSQNSSGRSGDKDDKYSMAGLGILLYTMIPAILLSLFYTVITFFEWKKLKATK